MNISKIIRNILKAPLVILIRVPAVLLLRTLESAGRWAEDVSWKADKILPAFER